MKMGSNGVSQSGQRQRMLGADAPFLSQDSHAPVDPRGRRHATCQLRQVSQDLAAGPRLPRGLMVWRSARSFMPDRASLAKHAKRLTKKRGRCERVVDGKTAALLARSWERQAMRKMPRGCRKAVATMYKRKE